MTRKPYSHSQQRQKSGTIINCLDFTILEIVQNQTQYFQSNAHKYQEDGDVFEVAAVLAVYAFNSLPHDDLTE